MRRGIGRLAAAAALVLGSLAWTPAAGAQSTTPFSHEGVYLVSGGDVVTTPGAVLEGADVLIRDGRIAAVGRGLPAPAGAVLVDAAGLTVYPGLIDSHTGIGLSEMTDESNDRSEMGRFTPHLRTISAVNAHSNAIPLARANGITAVVTVPAGGVIPGPASLVQLEGRTWEQMALRPEAAMLVLYPRSSPRGGRTDRGEGFEAQVAELREYLREAQAHERAGGAGAGVPDLALEAMRGVARGEVPLLVQADAEEEIRSAIALTEELGLRMILLGARDAWKVADLLAAKRVPVVLGSVLRMPDPEEPYDVAFAQAAALDRAGVKFAFSTGSTSGVRNLPYHAGMSTAYGLSPESALRALTIAPAEIWGVSDELGSIEVGKRANLFIADGDVLDVRTRVLEVFVDGRRASPDHRHRRLYEKFSPRQRP